MGSIRVSFDVAESPPYGSTAYAYGAPIDPLGPTRLARLFDRALSRSTRRIRERARAMERKRPRLVERVSIYDIPTPPGWERVQTRED